MSHSKEILVAKFGSSSITHSEGIDSNQIADSVRQLAELREQYRIVVVHSGSVALGRRFAIRTVGEEAEAEMDDVDRASAGSALITAEFQDFFADRGVLSGQALLTHKEIEGKTVGPSIVERIKSQLAKNKPMVPLVNENDFVSDEELKKLAYGGDNDGLASHVARAIGAHKLLLLTDRDGFEIDGIVVPTISYDEDFNMIVDNIDGEGEGTGGIFSKVENAAEFVGAGPGRTAHIGNVTADYSAILAEKAGTRVLQ